MTKPKYMTREDAAALVAGWDGLAWKFARKYHRLSSRRGDLTDYHAAGVLGLWEAALRFDPTVASFGTYAHRWVHLRVMEHSRAEASGGLHVPSYRGVVRFRPGPFAADFDPPAAQSAMPTGGDFWDAVDRRLPSDPLRAVVRMLYADGLNEIAVAAAMKCCRAQVNKLKRRAIDILRRHPALIEAA